MKKDEVAIFYQNYFPGATLTYIDHEDAIVAIVFRVIQPNTPDLILKVCPKTHYLREAYFLQTFVNKIPVPRMIQLIEPKEYEGAILMQCLEGQLLTKENITKNIAFEIGTILAHVHLERTTKYGDCIDTEYLNADPRVPFTLKFEEGILECKDHFSEQLLINCKKHFHKDIDLLVTSDGPCIIHRDFRPGNILIDKGKVSGIIDWSSARAGFAEEDFFIIDDSEWPIDNEFKNYFLLGYASIRKVPDYEKLMPLLRLHRAIASVGFTLKSGTWNTKSAKLYRKNKQYLESLIKL